LSVRRTIVPNENSHPALSIHGATRRKRFAEFTQFAEGKRHGVGWFERFCFGQLVWLGYFEINQRSLARVAVE